jgi:hypothetical protein
VNIGVEALACPSPKLCVAAGGGVASTTRPLSQRKWKYTPIDGGNTISQLACPSSSLCVAGDANGSILTTHDPTGPHKAWKITHLASGPARELVDLACPTASLCVAADHAGELYSTTDPTGGQKAWKSMQLHLIPTAGAISCASESLCLLGAGGNVIASTNPTGDAGTWKTMLIDPLGALSAISCPSATLCLAADSKGNVLVGTAPQPG